MSSTDRKKVIIGGKNFEGTGKMMKTESIQVGDGLLCSVGPL